MIEMSVLLAAALAMAAPAPGAPEGGEADRVPYARYTFGSLGGKRKMLQDADRTYSLASGKSEKNPHGWLQIHPKAKGPAGGAAVATPEPVGRLKLRGIPEALEWVDGKTVAVGTGNHIALVDVASPAAPRLLEEIPVARREIDGASDLRRSGRWLLAAARRQGLLRIDLASPGRPRRIERLPLPGSSMGLDVAGDLAAVATGTGVSFVRLGEGAMRLESSLDTLRNAELVRLQGKRLFLASKEYLVLYDIADPGRPAEVAETSTRDVGFFSHMAALHADGDLVFAAVTEGGFYVWDWKSPRDPKLLIQFSSWGSARRLGEEGKLAYLKALGLEATPEAAARLLPAVENVRINAVGMAVEGSRAFLVDYEGKLWAIDFRLEGDRKATLVMRPD